MPPRAGRWRPRLVDASTETPWDGIEGELWRRAEWARIQRIRSQRGDAAYQALAQQAFSVYFATWYRERRLPDGSIAGVTRTLRARWWWRNAVRRIAYLLRLRLRWSRVGQWLRTSIRNRLFAGLRRQGGRLLRQRPADEVEPQVVRRGVHETLIEDHV